MKTQDILIIGAVGVGAYFLLSSAKGISSGISDAAGGIGEAVQGTGQGISTAAQGVGTGVSTAALGTGLSVAEITQGIASPFQLLDNTLQRISDRQTLQDTATQDLQDQIWEAQAQQKLVEVESGITEQTIREQGDVERTYINEESRSNIARALSFTKGSVWDLGSQAILQVLGIRKSSTLKKDNSVQPTNALQIMKDFQKAKAQSVLSKSSGSSKSKSRSLKGKVFSEQTFKGTNIVKPVIISINKKDTELGTEIRKLKSGQTITINR